ncbi:MAG: Polypeptide-transport-associated domain protein ShlB-type [Puniceicoccaceae bacterium 5H]|nr:MAG: Polypeptide-transport-associated domain protein ShlB-type [Puniceicoccaceae bacterium 5H]
MNDLSGLSFKATLQPGTQVGGTDLVVNVKEDKRVISELELNNFGTENTGEYRFIPSVTLPNFSGRGDELGVAVVSAFDANETLYGTGHYSRPVGYNGLALNGYVSAGRYEIGEEFAFLGSEGENFSFGVGASYPIFKTTERSLMVDGWFSWLDSQQDAAGQTIFEDNIRKLQLGLSFDDKDSSGRTMASAKIHQGLGEVLGGMESDSTDSSRGDARADNVFTKLSFDVARLQRINDRMYLIARFSGQIAANTLVASEEWSIGGANSVRGFPQGIHLGDHGYTANLESRYTVFKSTNDYQLVAFVDQGAVYLKNPLQHQADSYSIGGAGVGTRVAIGEHASIRADVAVPFGEEAEDDVSLYLQGRFTF